MIPKPFVPVQISEAQEEKSIALKFGDYVNNVALWNSETRQWEFKNGQMMNCYLADSFSAKEE
jgi:hypothetical protein